MFRFAVYSGVVGAGAGPGPGVDAGTEAAAVVVKETAVGERESSARASGDFSLTTTWSSLLLSLRRSLVKLLTSLTKPLNFPGMVLDLADLVDLMDFAFSVGCGAILVGRGGDGGGKW